MSEDVNTTDEGGNADGTTIDKTTIVIDGKEVEVPNVPEVIDKFKALEHDLRSRNDRILATERQEIQKMQQQHQEQLQYDLNYLNEHPDEIETYRPKIIYGDEGGYGTPQNTRTRSMEKTFEEDPLAKKVAELEKKLEAKNQYDNEIGKNRVIRTLESVQKEYAMADMDAVKERLENYYARTGQHADTDLVRQYVKQSHEHVTKFIPKNKQVEEGVVGRPKAATPKAGTAAPDAKSEKKIIPLYDTGAIVDDYKQWKQEQQG